MKLMIGAVNGRKRAGSDSKTIGTNLARLADESAGRLSRHVRLTVIKVCGEKQMYRPVRPARSEKELRAAADEAWLRRQMLSDREHPFCEVEDRR